MWRQAHNSLGKKHVFCKRILHILPRRMLHDLLAIESCSQLNIVEHSLLTVWVTFAAINDSMHLVDNSHFVDIVLCANSLDIVKKRNFKNLRLVHLRMNHNVLESHHLSSAHNGLFECFNWPFNKNTQQQSFPTDYWNLFTNWKIYTSIVRSSKLFEFQ